MENSGHKLWNLTINANKRILFEQRAICSCPKRPGGLFRARTPPPTWTRGGLTRARARFVHMGPLFLEY